ncbi:MAG: exopolysaccharide biosynthesis polyprenyl glycosylphosphotransferase [Candidatus Magasanikbacteria bacterium]|jgi:exopolysaccharide biosynthesis polyprenyl glycosylphosphotransferase
MFYRLKQLTLMAGDFVALLFGLFLALSERYVFTPGAPDIALLWPMIELFIGALLIIFISGLYDIGQNRNNLQFFQKILMTAFAWVMVGMIYFYLRPALAISPKTILALTALNGFGLLTVWRYIYNRFLSTGILKTTVVFTGVTPEIIELIALLEKQPERGYRVAGFIMADNLPAELSRYASAPTLKILLEKNNNQAPQIIVTAPMLYKNASLLKELYEQLFAQTTVMALARFYEDVLGRIPPFTFSEGWFLNNLNEQQKKIYDRTRIVTDYFFASLMAIFFVISFPFIYWAIRLTSPGPIFFRQQRVGRMGQVFFIYKYRTMKVLAIDGSAETAGAQFASVDDARVTRVGKFLRQTRLDEIPQFINIFRNEMGLIGPRPERPEFVYELTRQMPFYSLRCLIKPGLTGWAQVQKSYYGTLEENLRKLEYDLFYIKNRGFWLDFAIVMRTVNIVLGMRGR